MQNATDKEPRTFDIPEHGKVRRYKIDENTFAYVSAHLPDIRRSVKPRIAAMLYGFQDVTIHQHHHVIIVTLSPYTSLQRLHDFQMAIIGHIVRVLRTRSRTECPGSTVQMIDDETGEILGDYSF